MPYRLPRRGLEASRPSAETALQEPYPPGPERALFGVGCFGVTGAAAGGVRSGNKRGAVIHGGLCGGGNGAATLAIG